MRLSIKLITYQLFMPMRLARHTGMDCRYPEHRAVIKACHPWLPDFGTHRFPTD